MFTSIEGLNKTWRERPALSFVPESAAGIVKIQLNALNKWPFVGINEFLSGPFLYDHSGGMVSIGNKGRLVEIE